MKLLTSTLIALVALVGVGATASAHNGNPPCADHAPAATVVRIHRRCSGIDVRAGQRLDVVIGRKDAPARWREAWGGDGSLRWAERELNRLGCARIVWRNGTFATGIDCDF